MERCPLSNRQKKNETVVLYSSYDSCVITSGTYIYLVKWTDWDWLLDQTFLYPSFPKYKMF
jgi:hypothetical protein